MELGKISIILLLALLASGVFVACFSNYSLTGPDSIQYNRLGINLASGNGFSLDKEPPYSPTMFREPAYPAILAFIYRLFGIHVCFVLVMQMAFHALTAVLAFYIAKEVFSGQIAFISGIAVAIFPTLVNMTAYVLSETVFTFLLCLAIYIFIVALKGEKTPLFIIAALVLEVAALTKAAALLLPFIFVAVAIVVGSVKRLDPKKLIINLLVFVMIFCVTVSGWMARNKMLFNTASITLRGGEALWSRAQKIDDPPKVVLMTACYSVSEFLGAKLFPDESIRPERYLFKDFEKAEALRIKYAKEGLSDARIEEIFRKDATDKILKKPLSYAAYTFIEAIKMTAFTYLPVLNEAPVREYFRGINGGMLIFSALKGAMRIAAYPILLLFVIGAIRHLKAWDKWILIFVTALYFNVIYSLLDAIGRYAIPLIPLYCIMAVAAFFPPLAIKE